MLSMKYRFIKMAWDKMKPQPSGMDTSQKQKRELNMKVLYIVHVRI